MKEMGVIQGSAEQAKALIVGKDTVYIHTEISPAEKDGGVLEGLFSYHEVQYGKDEYIELLAKQNQELSESVTDTELALCEFYEGGAANG